MSTKSNKINWSNNLHRQSHLVDCSMAIFIGCYIILAASFWVFGADSQTILFWTVATMVAVASVLALFGAVQAAFVVVPLVAAKTQSR